MNETQLVKTQGLEVIDPAAIAAAETAKANIQAAYLMALKKPRDEDQARARIIQACRRPGFAEKVEFSKPIAGKPIKGPSIRFAELALREWGNIFSVIQVVYEDEQIRRINIRELDLETNISFSKELVIRKHVERKNPFGREVLGERINTNGEKVYIVLATEDELGNKESALISKAVRTEGLRLIPTDIIDEALETARETLRHRDSKDPSEGKKKLQDAFLSINIYPKDLAQLIGHSMDKVSPKELEELRGIYRAIKDGEASWQDYLQEVPQPKDDLGDKIKGMPEPGQELKDKTEEWDKDGFNEIAPKSNGPKEKSVDPRVGKKRCKSCKGFWEPEELDSNKNCPECTAKVKPKTWSEYPSDANKLYVPEEPPLPDEPPWTEEEKKIVEQRANSKSPTPVSDAIKNPEPDPDDIEFRQKMGVFRAKDKDKFYRVLGTLGYEMVAEIKADKYLSVLNEMDKAFSS